MIKSIRMGISELIYNKGLLNLLIDTGDDRFSEEDCIEAIRQSQIYFVYKGDELCGFYTIDLLSESVEAHAYILEKYRRYSLAVIRHIVAQYECITTSVYGTHKHVLKFLMRIGFKVTSTLTGVLLKDGENHDVWLLSYQGGPNG